MNDSISVNASYSRAFRTTTLGPHHAGLFPWTLLGVHIGGYEGLPLPPYKQLPTYGPDICLFFTQYEYFNIGLRFSIQCFYPNKL